MALGWNPSTQRPLAWPLHAPGNPPVAVGTFEPAQGIPSPVDPPVVFHPSEATGLGNTILCPRPLSSMKEF